MMKTLLPFYQALPSRAPFTIPAILVVIGVAAGQVHGQTQDTPQARMRPIGSPSMVDLYQTNRSVPNTSASLLRRETVFHDSHPQPSGGVVRQTAMQIGLPSDLGSPDLSSPDLGSPPSSVNPQQPFAFPPSSTGSGASLVPDRVPQTAPAPSVPVPSVPQAQPLPQTFSPQVNALPTGPRPGLPTPTLPARTTDFTPLSQPVLGNEFATVNNCPNVTGPSSYTGTIGSGFVPVNYQSTPFTPTFVPPPAQLPAPAVLPSALSGLTPQANSPSGQGLQVPVIGSQAPGPASALVTFGQQFNSVQVGPGLLGQPKAYVPGQYFRNWLRYFTP